MPNKIKKKVDSLIDLTKGTIGIGLVGTAGLGSMGALGAYGAPVESSKVTQATSAGVGLAAVGQTTKIGSSMTLMGEPKKKTKFHDDILKKIWG